MEDASGRPISIKDPLGLQTSLTYDGVGNLLQVKDGLGNTRAYAYDGLNRLSVQTDGLGNKRTYQYDAAGNVSQVLDRNGQVTTYSYDADNRLTRTAFPDGDVLTNGYDGLGRTTLVSNNTSSINSTYDAGSRLASQTVTGPAPLGSVTTTYAYDAVGNRISMSGPDGQTLYGYDSRSRLTSLTDPSGGIFKFGYDSASRLISLARPNGVTDSLTYNADGQLTSETSSLGASTVAQLSQSYDTAAHIASRTDSSGTTSYTHDPDGQLTGVTPPSQAAQSYNYDAGGNRIASPGSPAGTLAYGANNQLLSDANYVYSYSNEGDRTAQTNKVTGASTKYTYNSRHQLVAVTSPDGTTTTYKYDPLGRRVQISSASQTTSYVYDRENVHLEYGGSALAASYTNGFASDARLEVVRGGAPYYYHQDGLQNVTRLTDRNGATAATYTYDAFGAPGASTGNVANPFTFTGREYDPSNGLYFYRARSYDPRSGTFLSEDPVPATNSYSYVHNDPVDLVDPSGTQATIDYSALVFRVSLWASSPARAFGCYMGLVGVAIEQTVDQYGFKEPLDGFSTVQNYAVGCILGALFPDLGGLGLKTVLLAIIALGVFVPFLAAFLGDLAHSYSCGQKPDAGHAFKVGVEAASVAAASAAVALAFRGPRWQALIAVLAGAASAVLDHVTPGASC
jgi:RHS repeat-associated protein